MLSEIGCLNVRDICIPDQDPPVSLRQVIKPVQKMHQCRLPAAGSTKDSENTSAPDPERYIPQHLSLPVVICIAHMFKHNVAVHRRAVSPRRILLHFGIHNISKSID